MGIGRRASRLCHRPGGPPLFPRSGLPPSSCLSVETMVHSLYPNAKDLRCLPELQSIPKGVSISAKVSKGLAPRPQRDPSAIEEKLRAALEAARELEARAIGQFRSATAGVS